MGCMRWMWPTICASAFTATRFSWWAIRGEAFWAWSWRTVIPTIRKPGSEIWISFNPELETDDTYQRFVVNPPPNAVVVKTSFRDNPALSEELRIEIDHLKATDPDE